MGLIKGLHHVSLSCTSKGDFEKTVAFYRDVLGLTVVLQAGEGKNAFAMLDTGDGIVEVFANAAEKLEEGAIRHLALQTDDVDACVEAVVKAGYPIYRKPMDVELDPASGLKIRVAFIFGPVGEQIEFFQK